MKAVFISALLVALPMISLAADAPADGDKSDARNLLRPTNELESWTFELNDAGKGEMKVDGDAIVFETAETTGTDWHVQAYQTGLDLKDGQEYTIKFQLKSPEEVNALLVGQIHEEDWHEIGLHEEIAATDEFKDYEFTFEATGVVENNNRIGFVLGIEKGTVMVKDLTLTEKE